MIKAIFTNIKNENRYLEEWLNHHIRLGFNKFILYEDEGSVSHIDIIKKYKDIIDIDFYDNVLFDDGIHFKDFISFKHILNNYNDIDWLVKLDPDEFFFLPGNTKIDDYLYRMNDSINQITFDWRLYNANTFIKCPYSGKYSVIDTYIDYIEKENLGLYYDINVSKNEYDWGKTLLRYKYFYSNLKGNEDAIISEYYPYQFYSDAIDHILDGTKKYGIYINHYITKSFEEFYQKLAVRGQDKKKNPRTIGDFFVLNPDMIKDIPEIENKFNINIY